MNSIQFESARDKEKARADLREARDQLLDQAKKRAELRAEKDVSKQLKGETNWMLPSVEKKLKRKEKGSKKKKKDAKKIKKSKKKSNRKRKHHPSSAEESDNSIDDDSSTTDRSSSGSSDVDYKRKKRSKKSKKKHKQKRNSKKSSSSDSDSDEEADEWVEAKTSVLPIQRDSWMTDSLMLKTFSRERTSTQPKEKQHIDAYDPAKSSRELNPYWKETGTGLPAFQKPRDDDNHSKSPSHRWKNVHTATTSKGWRKQSSSNETPKEIKASARIRSATPPSERSSSSSESSYDDKKKVTNNVITSQFLTDQQMNELGAKIMKAEIIGNMTLADELRQKLDNARIQRNVFKERKKTEIAVGKSGNQNINKSKKQLEEEHILLAHTDQSGQSRPVTSRAIDPRDMYGGKVKQKRVKTHDSDGQRVRYFADDDRYNLKEMFEIEKMTSVSDANLQFADIASKNKNPNDDLEDIFADNICKDDSTRDARKDRDHAIREHQIMENILDNCDKCFDSTKLHKELLVSVGEKAYLALPWYQGLQSGHCMIIPTQHSTCSTQLDEDTWTEINDYRKALTRMFSAQHKDVIFFEIANRLHKRPHLVIHCIPIKETQGEMAPFYFKKAIEESEHEWSVNKQLVSLRNKSLRSCIPKGLPYFWVNFGMDTGFAHVIEDEKRFPPNFAQEIIGGMLHLDANKWRRLQKETNIITKVKLFADWWKKYDCCTK